MSSNLSLGDMLHLSLGIKQTEEHLQTLLSVKDHPPLTSVSGTSPRLERGWFNLTRVSGPLSTAFSVIKQLWDQQDDCRMDLQERFCSGPMNEHTWWWREMSPWRDTRHTSVKALGRSLCSRWEAQPLVDGIQHGESSTSHAYSILQPSNTVANGNYRQMEHESVHNCAMTRLMKIRTLKANFLEAELNIVSFSKRWYLFLLEWSILTSSKA